MSNHQGGRSKATAETPFARFQLWHRRLAWETMTELFDKGQKLLQILQGESCAVLGAQTGWKRCRCRRVCNG